MEKYSQSEINNLNKTTNDILDMLRHLPKDILLLTIETLIYEKKVSLSEIVDMHTATLESLKTEEQSKFIALETYVLRMWHDKDTVNSNLKEAMKFLKEVGRHVVLDETIDNKEL